MRDLRHRLPNGIHMGKLCNLLKFSDRYEISIQFWPEQINVFIEKDGVELGAWGGDFEHAIGSATEFLKRINRKP